GPRPCARGACAGLRPGRASLPDPRFRPCGPGPVPAAGEQPAGHRRAGHDPALPLRRAGAARVQPAQHRT
ncbi:3-phosphoshikimate 1-carboxyvinyltransferase, partial [Escherichia coli]